MPRFPSFLVTLVLLGCSVLASRSDEAKQPTRPNILVIVSDNQPWWGMGCAGNEIISTPHLDRLAAEGVRFTNAFATTPICAASRASLFTGLYRRGHGFTFNTPPLRAELAAASYPAVLKNAGYRTALIGKFGIESNGKLKIEGGKRSLDGMFDHFDNFEHWGGPGPKGYFVKKPDGSKRHLTDVTADKAVKFLETRDPDGRPFCLSLSFNAPHAQDNDPKQYIWPERFDALYRDATIPPPVNSEPEFFKAQPAFLRKSLGRVRWGWRFDTPEKFQAMMKGMFRMVSGVDDAVGRVRGKLKELGLEKDTVIVYLSDNGMLFGERGLSDCWLLYEESIRVPFLIHDPRGGGKDERKPVRDEFVLNIDLAPTILDFAGVITKPPMDGQSLVPLLTDAPVADWRTDFLCEHLFAHKKIPRSEGVRTTKWKFIRYIDQEPAYEELYDLSADPHERVNLAPDPDHATDLERLRKRCDQLIAEAQ